MKKPVNFPHYCPDFDFDLVSPGDPEMDFCLCTYRTDEEESKEKRRRRPNLS